MVISVTHGVETLITQRDVASLNMEKNTSVYVTVRLIFVKEWTL